MSLRDFPRNNDRDDGPPGEIEYELDEEALELNVYPTLYYDPIRFPEPADVARLEWEMRSRSPADHGRDWLIEAVTPASLKRWSPFPDGKTERRFLARGYVSNCEDLPATRGTPTYTVQQQESLRAFQRAIVVAEAVIKAAQHRLGTDCPAWLQVKSEVVLTSVTGRRTSKIWDREEKKALSRARNVPLILHDGLVFGCTDFTQERRVVASSYYGADIAGNEGKRILHEGQREPDGSFQALITRELGSADPAMLPGIALWACQRVALCRIALEEARWHHSPARKQALTQRWITMPLGRALDRGFRSWTRTISPSSAGGAQKILLRSQTFHASEELLERRRRGDPGFDDQVDVFAIPVALTRAHDRILTDASENYDHFGWVPPRIVRLAYSLRRCVERAYLGSYVPPIDDHWDEPRGDLQTIAAWLGELRRWGRGMLDASHASVLDRVLRGCSWEEHEREFESADGQAAIAYLKGLMPPTFWSDIEAALDGVLMDGPTVPILYDDRTPVGPVWRPGESMGMAGPIVVQGPILDFPVAEARWWMTRAAGLSSDGLLVRPPNEEGPPEPKGR
ncbi:hypothetical protein [Methylobacterium aquaticum]|uniref:hypothetical protein n=1 Tax=Methylobacterium aquaticum TaxID=270351 RepID=UPI00193392C7|nr:hypothetical protein [Methylobacterium aquaticum]QRE78291.1 hypothetical protein F1D61_33240 [Methylobacterium aquaticum]QRE78321.1 hypothetical protein F1D61_33430 [Methylobacterium aquaticum]